MRRVLRENALCALMAGAGSVTLAWLGLYSFAWNDYEVEVRPAFDALLAGHVGEFLRLAPTYGGSLVERAPFALLPGLWGGGSLAVYRMLALPCLLASAVLGIWLVARMRAGGHSILARACALSLCVASPIALRALEVGHPEEILGGSLCVAAVLLAAGGPARRERPIAAGVILGLAIANKEWALLAAGPVLLALPAGRRWRALASTALTAAAVLAPLALASTGSFVASARSAASPASAIFQPWQLWWFLGGHGHLVHGAFGVPKPGYRMGPAWTSLIAHPLIVIVGIALSAILWLRLRGSAGSPGSPGALPERDALLTLALLMLLRCLLDTWDAVYYAVPFLLALLAWEVSLPQRRAPVLTLASTILVWVSFQWLAPRASPDVQAAFYLAWSTALAGWLGLRLFSPARPARTPRPVGWSPGGPQEMTVSVLESRVRIS